MIHTLEDIKKRKNYIAASKGYPIDPEGFTLELLNKRLHDELKEYESALRIYQKWGVEDDNNASKVVSELADLSNFIDYIASKIITQYPDKYSPDKTSG